MKIRELRRILDELALKSASEGAAQLSVLLQPLDNISIADLHELIAPTVAKRAKIEAKAQQATLAAEKKQQAAAAEETVTAGYVTELNATKSDNKAFENVAKRIVKAVKLPQAQEIVRRFTGSPATPRTKNDALKALFQRQISDQRAAARAAQVSEIF